MTSVGISRPVYGLDFNLLKCLHGEVGSMYVTNIHCKLQQIFSLICSNALINSLADDSAQVAQMNHPVSIKLVTILTN